MQFRFTRVAVLVVGLAVAAAGCGKYSISNIRSLKAFKDATELYQKGDYRDAAAGYERSIQFNPDWGFSYFYLGNSYDKMYKPARKGEPDNDANLPKAVENYRLAIEKLANSPEPQAAQFRKLAYEYLVAAYGTDRLNDFSKAEGVAKELIAMEPEEPGNYQALARLYEDQGRMEDAEAMFIKATEVKPNDPVGFQLLASFYNRRGEFDKMMGSFQKRADMEPNNPEAWHTMATYYFDEVSRDKRLSPAQAKTYVQAGLQAEDKALGLNPEYYEAVTYKSLLLALEANLEKDRDTQKRLLAEADTLRSKALDLQKKQESGAAAAAAAKGKK
jgi:tetratricopeptide (TPR) repeat protein